MARQIAAEWIKLRSLRSTWFTIGLAVVALVTVKDHSSEELALGVMSGSSMTLILVVVLGVTATAAEYSQKSITTTYTVTPGRWRVLAAKAIVVAGVALALGLLSVPLGRLIAAIWFAFGEGSWNAGFGDAVHYAVGIMIGYVGFSILGVMIGTLARSPALGVGIAFGLLFVIDPLLGSFSFYSEYSTSAVSQTLLDPDNLQSNQPLFGSAISLLALYAVILAGITLGVEDRRDVHA
ncbi:MAG: ABC transporter permease [Actinomycetota bacterium]